MTRLRQDRAALAMIARENPRAEEENPYWSDDLETSLRAIEIVARPEEVVLVTRTAKEPAALRGWGALAVARHHAGWWCAASRHARAQRDVLVFVDARAGSGFGWAEEDVQVLAGTVGRPGRLVPVRRLPPKLAWSPRGGRPPSAAYEVHPGLTPRSH